MLLIVYHPYEIEIPDALEKLILDCEKNYIPHPLTYTEAPKHHKNITGDECEN